MIDIIKILKRSWHILWNYRILWVFGFFLALTTGGGYSLRSSYSSSTSNTGISNWPSQISGNLAPWQRDFIQFINQAIQWFDQQVVPVVTQPAQHIGTIILFILCVFLACLLIGAVVALIRYPSETAVMRMVDEYERSGSKVGFRKGWKLGWSRRAFRMWLIDLIVSLPFAILILILVPLGLIIYYKVSSALQINNVVGIVAIIGFVIIVFLLAAVFAVFVSLLRNFFVRFIALEDRGVGESFTMGWTMFKRNWKSTGLMWLVMIGIGIIFGIASMLFFFLLIPAYIVLIVPALLVAVIPGLVAFGIAHIFLGGVLTWIIGILVALPFFFIVLFSPLVLVEGFYKIYASSVWTLTFRELRVLQNHNVVTTLTEKI